MDAAKVLFPFRAPLALAISLLVLGLPACRKKPAPSPPPPPPPRQSQFILLPEEGHPVSAVLVSNAAGSQSIGQPYHVVRVTDNATAPSPAVPIDREEVDRRFGALLATLPAAAQSFSLGFDADQSVIAAESRPTVALILAAIESRRSTSVTVIGHTDTTNDPQSNYELGLRRARAVVAEIRTVAPPGAAIFVASHGESDLLVKTADNVAEARNRRVEVIVR